MTSNVEYTVPPDERIRRINIFLGLLEKVKKRIECPKCQEIKKYACSGQIPSAYFADEGELIEFPETCKQCHHYFLRSISGDYDFPGMVCNCQGGHIELTETDLEELK